MLNLFSTIADVDRIFPELPLEVIKRAKAGTLKVREIVTQEDRDKAHIQRVLKAGYPIRVAPKGMQFFTDNAIFGNSVAFFVYEPQVFVVITSREVTESMKTLYELAWQSAQIPA